jgi:nucleoid DNA-binding protein
MAENKTKPTDASVKDYIAAIDDESRRKDCDALARMMTKVTGQKPTMWGPSIVGFGTYHFRYESGREGDSPLTGFSSRKGAISVYLVATFPGQDELLSRLGKHNMGKACLSIRKISEGDFRILEQLVAGSVAEVRRRYAPGKR